MDRIPTYLLTTVTAVMAVATALLGLTVPSLWSMAGDLGGIKARLDVVDRRLQEADKRAQERDIKLDSIGKRVDGIDARLVQRDSDPANLIAQSGLRPESEFGGVRIGEKLYALPKSDKAQAELAGSGLRREAITPSTFGYVLGTFDGAGRLQPASATAGSGSPAAPQ